MSNESVVCGPWKLDPQYLTLTHERGYEIDLEQCDTSAGVLEAILNVHKKPWAASHDIRCLIEALDFLLRPNQLLCPLGIEKGPINIRATVERILQRNDVKPFSRLRGKTVKDFEDEMGSSSSR